MVHKELSPGETLSLIYQLGFEPADIPKKFEQSPIDEHASRRATLLQEQALEGSISDNQYRLGYDALKNIVSWSAKDLESQNNTALIHEVDAATKNGRFVDNTLRNFFDTFEHCVAKEENEDQQKYSYLQIRKDHSFYNVVITRSALGKNVSYYMSVKNLGNVETIDAAGLDQEQQEDLLKLNALVLGATAYGVKTVKSTARTFRELVDNRVTRRKKLN